jgi:hypothetical protein
MTDFRVRFERELIGASKRLAREHHADATPARPRFRRRSAALALAALLVSGTALAATHPWAPTLGDRTLGPPPSVAVSGAPHAQLDALGVLRRAPGPLDRDAATQAGLRYIGDTAQGVHTDLIRRLETTAAGQAVVLVPAHTWRPAPGATVRRDVLCVVYPDAPGTGAAKGCFTLGDVRSGRAYVQLGTHVFGVVPDDVSSVAVRFAGGTSSAVAAVHDNFFDIAGPPSSTVPGAPVGARPQALEWIDAQGAVIQSVEL